MATRRAPRRMLRSLGSAIGQYLECSSHMAVLGGVHVRLVRPEGTLEVAFGASSYEASPVLATDICMSTENAPVPHPFADLLGFEITTRGDGRCTSELMAAESHLNPHGSVHGAVLYALADTGMGGALSSLLDAGERCSTIEIKINYFRPARPGRLRCETAVVHKGRRTGALESAVYDADDRLLARATGTFMILSAP